MPDDLPQSPIPYEQRLEWFHQARFGLFIHYGPYAVAGRGEWLMFNERIPHEDYARYAEQLRPDPDAARRWVDLAVRAGARYAVLTTRHHDGFSLFDSPANDFNLNRTLGRDLVAEFADACRHAGLRVGLYYSLLDWRFPGYFEPDQHPKSADALVAMVHAEVEHLVTSYGQIDVLWYDGAWIDHGRKPHEPAEYWRSTELNQMVYRHQPTILINNRSGLTLDLDTPEQHVTASEPGRGWEACMTIGDSTGWGWLCDNPNRKTEATLLQHLVTAAAGEGNFLINVGPRADGVVENAEVDLLQYVGDWLGSHGESIYGSQRCVLYNQTQPGAPLGLWTRKGNTAYLHLFRWPGREVTIPLVETRATAVTLLANGDPVRFTQDPDGRLHLYDLPARPPHPSINTLRFSFNEAPSACPEPDHAAWLR